MPIKSVKVVSTGNVGVKPNIIYIDSTDSAAFILTASYLNRAKKMGYSFSPSDIAIVNSPEGVFWAEVTVGNGNAGLKSAVNPGAFTWPVVDSDFVNFDGTSGKLKDAGYYASDTSKSVVSMVDGATTPGNFIKAIDTNGTIGDMGAAPSDPTKTIVSMSDGGLTAGNLVEAADADGTIRDAGLIASRVLESDFEMPSVNGNIFSVDVTITAAVLATGGSVVLVSSSGSQQYKILNMNMNSGGVNFSGGGGNRNVRVTDGTVTFTIIPTSALIALVNLVWGATGLPFPASAPLNAVSQAGEDIVIEYEGGLSDYTSGETIISAVIERVA